MTKYLIFFICVFATHSYAMDIPSDEEMIKRGRALLIDPETKMNQAQKEVDTKVDHSVRLAPGSEKKLTKEMVDEMMSGKLPSNAAADKKGKTDLIIFVSFSIPDDKLIAYSKQAKEAGATLVLRGLYEHSLTKTQIKAAPLNTAMAGYEINPVLFRKFKVNKVPSIILVDAESADVLENGCAQDAAFLKVDGDVSIQQALHIMQWQGKGKLVDRASKILKRIEG